MRVFLVDDSSLMRKELTDLILDVEGVEIVGETQTAKKKGLVHLFFYQRRLKAPVRWFFIL